MLMPFVKLVLILQTKDYVNNMGFHNHRICSKRSDLSACRSGNLVTVYNIVLCILYWYRWDCSLYYVTLFQEIS